MPRFEYNLCATVKSKFHMDIITEGSNCLHLFLESFLCLTCTFKSST